MSVVTVGKEPNPPRKSNPDTTRVRAQAYRDDAARKEYVDQLKTANLTALETFIRGKIASDGADTVLVRLAQAIALSIK